MAKTKSKPETDQPVEAGQPIQGDPTMQAAPADAPLQGDIAQGEPTPTPASQTQPAAEGSKQPRTQAIPDSTAPPARPAPLPPQPLSPSDERTWAMLAHLSVFANLATGLLGPVVALVIYLAYQQRSRYVAYHAMQSFVFQLIWWLGGGALAALAWLVSSLLSVVVVGCCLMPFALLVSLIPLGALVYGAIGAIQTSQGQDFKYWLVGDWVRSTDSGV
ncbi:MAG: DUF4870 domain-containing protein [Anaerolineales bacterium]|nr:DUF4870 domain-containing protein [Anaerolineales bacterium]